MDMHCFVFHAPPALLNVTSQPHFLCNNYSIPNLFPLFYHHPTSPTTARDRHLCQGGLSLLLQALTQRDCSKRVATGLNCWTDFFLEFSQLEVEEYCGFAKIWHESFQLYGYSPSKNVWENEIRDPSQDERWEKKALTWFIIILAGAQSSNFIHCCDPTTFP